MLDMRGIIKKNEDRCYPMLQLEEITLGLKQRYESFAKFEKLSFLRFANIFMSRGCMALRYGELEDAMSIYSVLPKRKVSPYGLGLFSKEGKSFAPLVRAAEAHFKGKVNYYELSEPMVDKLLLDCPGMFEKVESVDDEDYIYETEKLIRLAGKKYHSKRNFINRFESSYEYEYIPLTGENALMCLPALEEWFSRHHEKMLFYFDEKEAILELLHHFDALGLRGAAIKIDGKIRAMTIGEFLPPDTAHILIEKADIDYPGLYAVINQKFLEREWSHTKLVNREEDMGVEGLRKAKQSYQPLYQNKVFNAIRI